jgi:hypothetical protein
MFAVTFVIAKGDAYLTITLGVPINPQLYFVFGFIVFGVALSFAMRDILTELRKRAKKGQTFVGSQRDSTIPARTRANVVHRCPVRLVLLEGGIGLTIICGLVLDDRPISFPGYVIVFGALAAVLVIMLYTLRYSVTVTEHELRILGLAQSTVIPRSEIRSEGVVSSKGGTMLVITLRNGSKIAIWSFVTDFEGLLSALSANESP